MTTRVSETYSKLIKSLGKYTGDFLTSVSVMGKGNVPENAIITPFLLRDETNLELRLRDENNEQPVILHDNSHLYQHLLGYDIRVDSVSWRQKKYHDFISIQMERNEFGYDSNWKWFYKICDSKTKPEDIWKFIHSLQMMSALTLTKTLKNHQR